MIEIGQHVWHLQHQSSIFNHQSSVSVSVSVWGIGQRKTIHSPQPELCCWYVRWPLHERNWRPDRTKLNQILFKLKLNQIEWLSGCFPMLSVFVSFLYIVHGTLARARPLPSSRPPFVRTPTSVDLPLSTFPMTWQYSWIPEFLGALHFLPKIGLSESWWFKLRNFIVQLRSCHCDILHVFFHPVVCHVLNPRRKAQFMDHGSDPLRSNQSGALMAPGPITGMHDHNNVWPTSMVHRVLLHLTCFRLAINAIKNTNPSKGSAKNLLIISGNVFVIRSGTIHVLVQQFLIDLLLLLQKVLNASVTSYHMILRPSHLLALWSPSHWQSPPPGPPGSWC